MSHLRLEDRVWVKLTPLARVYSEKYLLEKIETHKKQDGWFEFTLVDLFKFFGTLVYSDHRSPFVDNKIFCESPF
jgi:hypothetical protein